MYHTANPRARKDIRSSQVKRNYTVDASGCVTFIPTLRDLYDDLFNSVSKAETTDYISRQIQEAKSSSYEVQQETAIAE